MVKGRAYGMWLMNSETVDRSWAGYTMTENGGGVTEVSADGASGEFLAYDFDGASNMQAANVGVAFTSGHHINMWIKVDDASPPATETLYDDRNGASGSGRKISIKTDGTLEAVFEDTSALTFTEVTDRGLVAGQWHMITVVWREGIAHDATSGTLEIYIDGQHATEPATYNTNMDGTIGATGDVTLGSTSAGSPGNYYNGVMNQVALVDGAITKTEVMEMFQHDAPAFLTGAKVLLQSSTTDAVLDVDIDPVTGLLDVMQTNDRIQIQGAVIVSEPAIASGGTTWEHGLVWNGATLGEINDANLFATRPAMDIRGFDDRLAGLEASDLAGQFPYCLAILTGTKSNGTGDGTEAVIGWDDVVIDTHYMWTGAAQFQSFHVRVPGWYKIRIHLNPNSILVAHTGMNIAMRRSGNTDRVYMQRPFENQSIGSGYNSAKHEATFHIELDEDDIIDFRYEVFGSTKTVDLRHDNAHDNWVEIERIA